MGSGPISSAKTFKSATSMAVFLLLFVGGRTGFAAYSVMLMRSAMALTGEALQIGQEICRFLPSNSAYHLVMQTLQKQCPHSWYAPSTPFSSQMLQVYLPAPVL